MAANGLVGALGAGAAFIAITLIADLIWTRRAGRESTLRVWIVVATVAVVFVALSYLMLFVSPASD